MTAHWFWPGAQILRTTIGRRCCCAANSFDSTGIKAFGAHMLLRIEKIWAPLLDHMLSPQTCPVSCHRQVETVTRVPLLTPVRASK